MKILRIYTKLPPLKGGMEKHIYNLSKLQLEAGHYVKIYYNDGEAVSNKDEKVSNIKFHSIKPQFVGIFIFYFLLCIKLFLKKEKFDIIHIHGDWSSLIFLKVLKKFTKAKKTCFSIHGHISSSIFHQKILPKLIQNVDLIFSTGYDTAKELEKLSKRNIIVQPSGVYEIFFENINSEYNSKQFNIVTVANLFPKKNIELILEIAKELKECNFIIIGDGTHKKVLSEKIHKEKIFNVELMGFKSPKEIKQFYQKSHCYLLTSFEEGTPTSALEAMACGLPIVSSNAGGLHNIIKENENGFISNNFEKFYYIEKINFLKKYPNIRQKIRVNNIKVAQNYMWNKVAQNITKIMERELNEKN